MYKNKKSVLKRQHTFHFQHKFSTNFPISAFWILYR